MSTSGKIKKPCGVYWDIGDSSAVGDSIRETVYLVRSVCQSNDLDDVSFQLISSVNSISNYVGDLETIKLITVSDYSKSNACAKIVQLIEQFLYEYEPGSPIILIDPNQLFSTPLSNLSTRFDFEIYFIHLDRTFDPSLEPIADNHFYLEGSSIYPSRPLSASEIGTIAVKNYPPTVDTFNLILEIDHLYKSYGRIENSTICTSELTAVWVFFPSQQLALNAANETQEMTFHGSSLSIVYLPELPCLISNHPILASLIASSRNLSPEKALATVDVDLDDPTSDLLPTIEIVPTTPDLPSFQVDTESTDQTVFQELLEPDQSSLNAAETLSQLSSANTTLNYNNENSSQTVNDVSVSSITMNDSTSGNPTSVASPMPVICLVPGNTTSSPNISIQEPFQSQLPSPIQESLDLNSTKNSDQTSEHRNQQKPNANQCIFQKPIIPFFVLTVESRPKDVGEDKFYRDMHGLFKKSGRLENTIIHNDAVFLGFPDEQTAKRVADEKNGMIYFGVSLRVTYIEEPSSTIILLMKKASKRKKTSIHQAPGLVVTMKSLKRSAPKSSIPVESVTVNEIFPKDIPVNPSNNLYDSKLHLKRLTNPTQLTTTTNYNNGFFWTRKLAEFSSNHLSSQEIGAISITNTPGKMEIRNLLSNLNGHFRCLGAVRDSAIWFEGAVWICFSDKKKARSVAAKSNGMNFQGVKLTVNYIENPPKDLENHFIECLLTSKVIVGPTRSKRTKRTKHSNCQPSSAKGSVTSIETSANPNASNKGSYHSSSKSVSTKNDQTEKGSKSKMEKSSNVPTNKQSTTTGQKGSNGSKSIEQIDIRSVNSETLKKNPNPKDTKSSHLGAVEMEKSHKIIKISSHSSDVNDVEECEDSEDSIAYCRSGGNGTVDHEASSSEETANSFDSLCTYMLSESIIYPIDGLASDSRFDYYQSNAYHSHKFADLVKEALHPDRFVVFKDIKFKAYPNKFWVIFHLLRLTWPYGVLKIAHTKNDVYILFVSSEGARSAVQLFNKSQDVDDNDRSINSNDLFPPLEEIEASVLTVVPSSVLSVVAIYSCTYSPWCFTENWDLFFLSIQVRDFVQADEFAVAKGVASNFGSLFIKPRDSHMIVAFADEKRIIHTMLFMRQSFIAKFDFCPNPTRPHDLFTLLRDYDLTGSCARLSQIALQQTFKLIQFKSPPPFIIVQESNDKNKRVTDGESMITINFNALSARTCETSPPTQSHLITKISQTPSVHFENLVNYYLKIEYDARHTWCYMYDLLSKLWYYRIVKITYKQDHLVRPAETWIEVRPNVNKDDLVKRLSAINYLKAPTIHLITCPPFDIINNSISTGSSPWFLNDALGLQFATVIPKGETNGASDKIIDIRTIKHIVEDEHAIFVKLLGNVIWIAFPDFHTLLQGLLLLNHEQRVRTGLMACSASNIPDDLLSSIEIDDLVGVARDLAIANTLEN